MARIFRSSTAAVQLTAQLIELAPGATAREVRRYIDGCTRAARRLHPAAGGDLLTLAVAILRAVDEAGDYDRAFEKVAESFNAGDLIGVNGTPLRRLLAPEDAAQFMTATVERFRPAIHQRWLRQHGG